MMLRHYLGVGLLAILPMVCDATGAGKLSEPVRALHVLNRLGYGARPGDIDRVQAMGIDRYIDTQLAPDSIPMPRELNDSLAALDTLSMTPVQLFADYGPPPGRHGQPPDREAIKARRVEARIIMQQAAQARVLRALNSPAQLQEVMTDFWYNHFNVFAGKGLDYLWASAYEQEAIRPNALGRFRDLLGATAHHPAMLFYLDNWQNTAPGSPGARGRFDGLNENYARELMELHTLGVDGGYTQQDVVALARILTGWGIRRRNRRGGSEDGFYFDPKRHDFSDKVFLGHTIKGSGMNEVEQALDILAAAPATAHHISYELAQYFVADHPDPALVNALAKRYSETDGDIRAVLKTLFHSPAFWQPANVGNKFKTPYEYVVSVLRATAQPVRNLRPINGILFQSGEPLYACQTPDGYKNTQNAWLNPDAMTRRLSFATALAGGYLPLTRPTPADGERSPMFNGKQDARVEPGDEPMETPQPVDAQKLMATFGQEFSKSTRDAIAAAPRQLQAALILGSPEFMRR
jgi:uncharacterized protein (DUF1800 family)